MKFINREAEMRRLDHLAHLAEGGVGVVWGRRRVGKTRLLLEWAHKHRGIYYTADESSPSVQRKYFALAIQEALPGFASVDYPDWTSLLMRLAKDAKYAGWKGPIVLDELPYLIQTSPELPSILQRFIDKEAKQAKLVLILCGSSQRMMQGAILDPSAPLYGRAEEILKLGPIAVGYIGQALQITHPKEIIEAYTVWGGIPRYWELAANTKESFLDTIDKLALDPMGLLAEEPNRLLLEESPPAISLRPILDAIGLGAHRLSEIAGRIGQPITSLVRPMQRLCELDLVLREIPFGTEEQNSKRALYKIKDPFLRFWFEVVAPRRSFFAQSPATIRKKWLKDLLPSLFSIMWEDLCRQAVPHLSQTWGEVYFGQAGRYWHGNGPEWDIVTQSVEKKVLLIGEAKWLAKIPTPDMIYKMIAEMQAKGIPPISRPQNSELLYALFVPEKPKKLDLHPNLKVVDAKEVLAALNLKMAVGPSTL